MRAELLSERIIHIILSSDKCSRLAFTLTTKATCVSDIILSCANYPNKRKWERRIAAQTKDEQRVIGFHSNFTYAARNFFTSSIHSFAVRLAPTAETNKWHEIATIFCCASISTVSEWGGPRRMCGTRWRSRFKRNLWNSYSDTRPSSPRSNTPPTRPSPVIIDVYILSPPLQPADVWNWYWIPRCCAFFYFSARFERERPELNKLQNNTWEHNAESAHV